MLSGHVCCLADRAWLRLQASNLAPKTPMAGGPSVTTMATPGSSSSSDLSSAGRTSSGKKAAKQRKGGLSMFLAGVQCYRNGATLRIVGACSCHGAPCMQAEALVRS